MTPHPDNSAEMELETRKRDKLSFLSRKSSMRLAPPDLKRQALVDLSNRASSGIFVYLPIWLFIAFWYDITSSNVVLFWVNTIILSVLVIARLLHLYLTRTRPESNTRILYNSLVLMLVTNALHWGILTAWIVSQNITTELHYMMIILLAAFAMGGTVTLSISLVARILYPIFIFTPPLLTLFFVSYADEFYMLGFLALFSMLYIMNVARLAGNDYWRAINEHKNVAESAKKLEQLSTTDPLTLLDNRLSFKKHFLEEWKRCSRYEISLCVLMIDLDKLKHINDTYGHPFGDECLRKVAATFRLNIPRETDVVARYGGDEFVVLLPGTDLEDAEKIADKLVKQTALIEIYHDGVAVPLSCSIGIACAIPGKSGGIDTLISNADKALYNAKAKGRNQWSSECTDSKVSSL